MVSAFFPTWPGHSTVSKAARLGLVCSVGSAIATATAKVKMVGTCQEWFDISPVFEAVLLVTSAWNLQLSKLKLD